MLASCSPVARQLAPESFLFVGSVTELTLQLSAELRWCRSAAWGSGQLAEGRNRWHTLRIVARRGDPTPIPDEELLAWLSANRLMPWTLRALEDLGGRAHLDALYKRLGQLLRIPEDLLWLEHPPEAEQEDYVVRHRMRLGLTDLKRLGLVHSLGEGMWSLTEQGSDFLRPLDEEDAPIAERDWSRETGIELTHAESELETKLNWRVLGRLRPSGLFQATAQDVERLESLMRTVRERRHSRSSDTLIAKFEGTCVICAEPINIGDAIAISYQDAPPDVEGWRHDRCSRRGPGGAAVPARVPKPGNSPRRPTVRRRRLPTKDDD